MYIGIDGGGTSTKAELHRDGHTERRKYGPFNISAIGEEAFRKLLREMFADWGRLEDCRALCVGGAGVSCGELEQIIREELKPTGFTGKAAVAQRFRDCPAGRGRWPRLHPDRGHGLHRLRSERNGRNGSSRRFRPPD